MTVRSAHRRSSDACRAVAICVLGAMRRPLAITSSRLSPQFIGFLKQTRQNKGFDGSTRDSLGLLTPFACLIGPPRAGFAMERGTRAGRVHYRHGYDR